MNKIFLVPFLTLIFPMIVVAKSTQVQKYFGDYNVTITRSSDPFIEKLNIKQREKTVFEESSPGEYYYFGNHFDERVEDKDPYSGRNITGNGIANLVISRWSGGAHCCHFLYIFELGKKFKKIALVEANSASVQLVDLDHDGFPEIEFLDGSIDYLFASYAYSPGGRTVLKFENDRYRLATSLMMKPRLSMVQIKRLKQKNVIAFKRQESPDLPFQFLSSLMDLSYSGHFDLALQIADDVWPANRPGLVKFKYDFAKALQRSLYWQKF